LIIATIGFTLGMMKFTRHGSFNPSDIGFYTSIGAGILWFSAMYFIFRKLIARKSEKNGRVE
jgi:hypothetical protein